MSARHRGRFDIIVNGTFWAATPLSAADPAPA
jgi:hypothetical protein